MTTSILSRAHSLAHNTPPVIATDLSYGSEILSKEPPVESVDRLAIFRDLGLHDRDFEFNPITCFDVRDNNNNNSNICRTKRSGATFKRLARSISVHGTKPETPPRVTRRFSDPSINRKRSRIFGARREEDMSSIGAVLETSSQEKFERWNSQKGKKWESIRAKKKKEEFRRRLEDQTWEQRKRTVNKVLVKFMCMSEEVKDPRRLART